jgi:hypothetical protein
MANILIPYSGGINSTYALWNWLSNTTHNITAVYSTETWLDSKFSNASEKELSQKTAADAIVSWLKSNVRDFEYSTTSWPVSYSEDMQPIREGFEVRVDVGIIAPRYRGYRQLLDTGSYEGIVVGISLENTATDNHDRLRTEIEVDGVAVYLAGTGNFSAMQKGSDFNYDTVATTLKGRFEQYEALPDAVCSLFVDPGTGNRYSLPVLYSDVRKQRTDLTGAELDAIFEEAGQYGRWRSAADPETYTYRGAWSAKGMELLGEGG